MLLARSRRTLSTTELLHHPRSLLHRQRPQHRPQSSTPAHPDSALRPLQATPPNPPRRVRRFLTTSALTFLFFAAGFAMAAAPAAEALNGFSKPPSDADTLTMFQPTTPTEHEVNTYLTTHPLAQRLRAEGTTSESRPHLKIPPAMSAHNLTAGALMGAEKLEVPPLNFNSRDKELPDLVQLMYFGRALCGHPGIVHGGVLATMLDEGLARTCFAALPNKVGVTANLKIDYRVPCPADRYVVLKAYTTKVEGRKAWVKGWIELLGDEDGEGVKLVEAEALFIEPKGAASMAKLYNSGA